MIYTYSVINRLEEPINYMYTPFEGLRFLDSYVASRIQFLGCVINDVEGNLSQDVCFLINAVKELEKIFGANSSSEIKRFRALFKIENMEEMSKIKGQDNRGHDFIKNFEEISIEDSISTLNLLHGLIFSLINNCNQPYVKLWFDRLVQRFEVSKVIYEYYISGFKKGQGDSESIRLYWLFALALSLYYSRQNEIKYLNTLLKVNDLLCSLPLSRLQHHIPLHGLSAVIATEVISVQLLSENRGISFDPQ